MRRRDRPYHPVHGRAALLVDFAGKRVFGSAQLAVLVSNATTRYLGINLVGGAKVTEVLVDGVRAELQVGRPPTAQYHPDETPCRVARDAPGRPDLAARSGRRLSQCRDLRLWEYWRDEMADVRAAGELRVKVPLLVYRAKVKEGQGVVTYLVTVRYVLDTQCAGLRWTTGVTAKAPPAPSHGLRALFGGLCDDFPAVESACTQDQDSDTQDHKSDTQDHDSERDATASTPHATSEGLWQLLTTTYEGHASQWLPCFDQPTTRCSWELTVVVAAHLGLHVHATGRRVKQWTVDPGWEAHRFESQDAVAAHQLGFYCGTGHAHRIQDVAYHITDPRDCHDLRYTARSFAAVTQCYADMLDDSLPFAAQWTVVFADMPAGPGDPQLYPGGGGGFAGCWPVSALRSAAVPGGWATGLRSVSPVSCLPGLLVLPRAALQRRTRWSSVVAGRSLLARCIAQAWVDARVRVHRMTSLWIPRVLVEWLLHQYLAQTLGGSFADTRLHLARQLLRDWDVHCRDLRDSAVLWHARQMRDLGSMLWVGESKQKHLGMPAPPHYRGSVVGGGGAAGAGVVNWAGYVDWTELCCGPQSGAGFLFGFGRSLKLLLMGCMLAGKLGESAIRRLWRRVTTSKTPVDATTFRGWCVPADDEKGAFAQFYDQWVTVDMVPDIKVEMRSNLEARQHETVVFQRHLSTHTPLVRALVDGNGAGAVDFTGDPHESDDDGLSFPLRALLQSLYRGLQVQRVEWSGDRGLLPPTTQSRSALGGSGWGRGAFLHNTCYPTATPVLFPPMRFVGRVDLTFTDLKGTTPVILMLSMDGVGSKATQINKYRDLQRRRARKVDTSRLVRRRYFLKDTEYYSVWDLYPRGRPKRQIMAKVVRAEGQATRHQLEQLPSWEWPVLPSLTFGLREQGNPLFALCSWLLAARTVASQLSCLAALRAEVAFQFQQRPDTEVIGRWNALLCAGDCLRYVMTSVATYWEVRVQCAELLARPLPRRDDGLARDSVFRQLAADWVSEAHFREVTHTIPPVLGAKRGRALSSLLAGGAGTGAAAVDKRRVLARFGPLTAVSVKQSEVMPADFSRPTEPMLCLALCVQLASRRELIRRDDAHVRHGSSQSTQKMVHELLRYHDNSSNWMPYVDVGAFRGGAAVRGLETAGDGPDEQKEPLSECAVEKKQATRHLWDDRDYVAVLVRAAGRLRCLTVADKNTHLAEWRRKRERHLAKISAVRAGLLVPAGTVTPLQRTISMPSQLHFPGLHPAALVIVPRAMRQLWGAVLSRLRSGGAGPVACAALDTISEWQMADQVPWEAFDFPSLLGVLQWQAALASGATAPSPSHSSSSHSNTTTTTGAQAATPDTLAPSWLQSYVRLGPCTAALRLTAFACIVRSCLSRPGRLVSALRLLLTEPDADLRLAMAQRWWLEWVRGACSLQLAVFRRMHDPQQGAPSTPWDSRLAFVEFLRHTDATVPSPSFHVQRPCAPPTTALPHPDQRPLPYLSAVLWHLMFCARRYAMRVRCAQLYRLLWGMGTPAPLWDRFPSDGSAVLCSPQAALDGWMHTLYCPLRTDQQGAVLAETSARHLPTSATSQRRLTALFELVVGREKRCVHKVIPKKGKGAVSIKESAKDRAKFATKARVKLEEHVLGVEAAL